MSFVTLIKDYVDVATSSDQLNGYTLSSLAYYTLAFLFSIIKQAIVYCFTFQWLQNFSYFCLTPPQLLSSFANITGIEHQPLSNLVAFSETNSYTSVSGIGFIFLGFFNGCFSCLHLSATNLITIQRLLVQGVPAGICSAFGAAVGQCFFLACILFGFRGFLFPWFALEPLSFLFGTSILLIIASTTAQDRRTPTIQWSSKSFLLIYISTSIVLAWCEQTAIFQLMGNINFGTDATLLETTPIFETIHTIFGNIQQLVQNITYLFAFFLGNFLGIFFLSYFLQRLLEVLLRLKGIPVYYGLIKQANLPLATLIFAFGFGSLPYYGFDYLITKGFGFIPQEHFLQQTIFSPINLVSKTSQTKEPSQSRLEDQLALLFTLEGEKKKSFVIDTTPFDDGQYLKVEQKRPQSFEDLNYRGEHLWTNRLSRISNIREQANQTQSSFLGPVFSWMRSFLWGNESAMTNKLQFDTTAHNNDPFSSNESVIEKLDDKADSTNLSIPIPNHPTDFVREGDIGLQTKEEHRKENSENASSSFFLSKQDKEGKRYNSSDGKHVNLYPNRANKKFVDNFLQKKELLPEREEIDNYVKEFDKQFDKGFSNFSNTEPTSLIEVEDQWQEKRIKEKCYTNPIYIFLLNTEIDSFLSRQPNNHWLSPQEEVLLLKRRQLLSNYYDTLSVTSQISTSEALNQLVPKSYTNAIYNHQFKGTLKTARRLFSIKKVSNEITNQGLIQRSNKEKDREKISANKKRVVKFDQPLFSKKDDNFQDLEKILFHEELNFPLLSSTDINESGVIKHGNSAYSKEASPFLSFDLIQQGNTFLLEQAEPLPLYASWDEDLRKLILTNRFQNQEVASYIYSEFPKTEKNSGTHQKSLSFTTWPLPNPVLPLYTTTKRDSVVDANMDMPVQIKNLNSAAWDTYIENNEKNPNTSKSSASDFGLTGNLRVQEISSDPKQGVASQKEWNNIQKRDVELKNDQSTIFMKPTIFIKNMVDHIKNNVIYQNSKNQFLFQTFDKFKEPATNDMINALLQWQKWVKENKQLSKEDKQAAKEKVSYWPKNVNRANWSNELIDNNMEFDEPTENVLKKQIILWEFIPPNHGGFAWPGSIKMN